MKFLIELSLDMSTLMTIETSNPTLTISNLQLSSQYYISVMICNYFDCGPSSAAISIETPSSSKFLSTIPAIVLYFLS